jgi:hypothetical protein
MFDSACKRGKRDSKLPELGRQVQVGIQQSPVLLFASWFLRPFKEFSYGTFSI